MFGSEEILVDESPRYTLVTIYDGLDGRYSTAVSHEDFRADWIVLEYYNTKPKALEGHKKWLKEIENDVEELVDAETLGVYECDCY